MENLCDLDAKLVSLPENVQSNDDLYKSAIEINGNSIWLWDFQKKEFYYSEKCLDVMGIDISKSSSIFGIWTDIIHPDDQKGIYEQLQKYLKKQIPYFDFEFRVKNKAGAFAWVHTKGKVINWDDSGKPLKMFGVHNDITNSKKMQQLAKENFIKSKIIFESSPIAIGISDSMGKVIDVNMAFLKAFGLPTTHDILGIDVFKNPNVPEDKKNDLMNGKTIRFELDYSFDLSKANSYNFSSSKSGYAVFDCLLTPFIDEDGEIYGYMGHFQDISQKRKTEKALEYSEKKYRTLLNSLDAMIFTTNIDSKITGTYGQWFDYNKIDKNIYIGKTALEIIGNQGAGFHNEIRKKVSSGENMIFNWNTMLNGRKTHFHTTLNPILNDSNEVEEIIGIGVDITNTVESEIKYKSLVEGTLVGIYLYQNKNIVYSNKYFEQMTGYSSEELLCIDVAEIIFKEDVPYVFKKYSKLKSDPNAITYEFRIIKKDGTIVYVLVQAALTEYNGFPAVIGSVIDITDRKKVEEQLNKIAFYDSLTNLPNRYLLNEYLKRLLDRLQSGENIAILFIDLDRFKLINDTLGHKFGDLVLEQASRRFLNCMRKNDFVSRYGGDEFVILLEDISKADIIRIAKKIINEFSNSFVINNKEVFTSVSIGISLYPVDSTDIDTLIKYADTAMYQAKNQGRNAYWFYTNEMNKIVSRHMELENGLRKAIKNNEFMLHYQPQIELSSGKIIGVEALIRWYHPEFGIISPVEFIPIAEETGLIVPIGLWVLETAFKQMIAWKNEGLPLMKISVNVSSFQIQQENFVETINNVIQNTGLNPKVLELEITESAIRDTQEIAKVLAKIKSLGVNIAIDDFGTGYSSLNILQHLTADSLKINHCFMNDIVTNPKTKLIVETIINMAKIMNLKIIAENIEDEEQLSILRQFNCTLGQGFLFSKPLPSEEIHKKLINDIAYTI